MPWYFLFLSLEMNSSMEFFLVSSFGMNSSMELVNSSDVRFGKKVKRRKSRVLFRGAEILFSWNKRRVWDGETVREWVASGGDGMFKQVSCRPNVTGAWLHRWVWAHKVFFFFFKKKRIPKPA
jgi:hypothetical protein